MLPRRRRIARSTRAQLHRDVIAAPTRRTRNALTMRRQGQRAAMPLLIQCGRNANALPNQRHLSANALPMGCRCQCNFNVSPVVFTNAISAKWRHKVKSMPAQRQRKLHCQCRASSIPSRINTRELQKQWPAPKPTSMQVQWQGNRTA
eukprot:1677386-Pyramimonas_sp.AAC.1